MNPAASHPLREFLPALPAWWIAGVYVTLGMSLVAFLWLARKRLSRTGVPAGTVLKSAWQIFRANPGQVGHLLASQVLGQQRVRRSRLGSAVHLNIVIPIALLTLGTALVAVDEDIFRRFFSKQILQGNWYLAFEFILDLAALWLVAGLTFAIWRRYQRQPSHLGHPSRITAVYFTMLYLTLGGLELEALRLLVQKPAWAEWSFAGNALSHLWALIVGENAQTVYEAAWLLHVGVVFLLITLLPILMLDHLFVLPLNIVLQSQRERGVLSVPFNLTEILANDGDLDEVNQGVETAADLPWQSRFSLDACVQCGRCEEVCPATAAGRALSPRRLIESLGAQARGEDGEVTSEEIWSCFTCGACEQECPAFIDQPGLVIELRRKLAEVGSFSKQQSAVLNSLERNHNPLGLPAAGKGDWLAELGVPTVKQAPNVEYLYWQGCMANYDPRVRQVAVAMIRVLQHAGVSFAVLGNEERCLGEAQRKLGDEAGFQMRAVENIELFNSYGIKKILTHCPHCLATLTRDYPQFGAQYEVIHHSQLLSQLISEGRVPAPAADSGETVTFHDPCNLGRIAGEVAAPREVLRRTSLKLIEAERSSSEGFCCGAGGANYFYQVEQDSEVASLRLDQLNATGADQIAVACPFCMNMLEGAGANGRVQDLAELIAANLP